MGEERLSMPDHDSSKAKEPVDYSGVKIGAILLPVFFLLTFLGNADVALASCIVLAAIIFAIKIRWRLRKHIWFWAIITLTLAITSRWF